MPFITEEIASHLDAGEPLITAAYPEATGRLASPAAAAAIGALQAVVQETRSYRHFVGLPPSTPLAVYLPDLPAGTRSALSSLEREIVRLAGLSALHFEGAAPAGAVRDVAGGIDLAIVLPDGALGESELGRLGVELDQARSEADKVRGRLADEAFVARAPEDVVNGARQRLAELERKALVLAETLEAAR
jgi:valyl-tRNA synthetase